MIRLLAAVPTPPPYAGPEVGMELLVRYWKSTRVELLHVRTTVRRSNAEKGRWDLRGVGRSVGVWERYCAALWRWRPQAVFLLLSSSWAGCVRDLVMIATARVFRARVLVQYRGGNFGGFYRSQPRWRQRWIRWGLRQVDRLFVQSQRLREQFAGLVPEERLRVLPNGIAWHEVPERQRCVAESLPYRLLFVGHLAFAKGFRELVRAYQRLRRELPVELWVLGTRIAQRQVARSFLPPEWQQYYDRHAPEIEAEIDAFLADAAQHNVRLLGFVSAAEVRQWMGQADLFVLPSYSEGFSMAVLEAMAAGLPVVVTPVGALPELVRDGVRGRLVPVGDADALFTVLRECLQQPEWMRRTGERNRQWVFQEFSIERVLKSLEEEVCAVVG